MHRSNWIGLFILFLCNLDLAAQQQANTTVLVIGASTGGTAAAIQCARMGVPTLLVESTPWLGGMLTSAGVSCTDGNDELWSGLWMEFREELYRHYGTRDLFTGWVSKTCFEPKVGDSIFKMMAAREKQLKIAWGWYFDRIIKSERRVTGALFRNQKGETFTVTARLTIDASDLGDAFASAGVAHDIGMEDQSYSQEAMAPGFYPVLQDLTWAATLQDYATTADVIIKRPPDYDSTNYFCCCTNAPCEHTSWPGSAQKMLDYGKLPLSPGQYQTKYMLNWPKFGNDDTLNAIAVPPIRREAYLQSAKNKTLGFIYFIQTRLGYKNIGLAKEFSSSDGLAYTPYYREGRRMRGVVRLQVNHILQPYQQKDPLYRTGIAVGDYPVDHHHAPEKKAPEILFPPIPSFSVPLGALIPEKGEGLLVCEKGISVSNIVNGATRLQPCVLLTGQAAGVVAALSVRDNISPRAVDVRNVQSALLEAKAYLRPFIDVRPDEPDWAAIQRIGVTGILRGRGVPEGWANKTYFDPTDSLLLTSLEEGLRSFYLNYTGESNPSSPRQVTLHDLVRILHVLSGGKSFAELEGSGENRVLQKREIAVLLDKYLDPFRQPVDLYGNRK